MTADAIVDDATLVRGVASGDRDCLAAIYDRYSGPLLGFCQNMLRRSADAEDCLQDVFVIAATRLGDLREPELLRSWLYSVARNECLTRLDRRTREFLMDDVPDRTSADADEPATAAIDDELAALVRDMSGGLSDRDRLLLELADRQQLTGDELAGALGVSRATAYTLVGRARTTARKSIGALMVARTGRQNCPELDDLLTGWDGHLTTLRRKQIAHHIDKCATCSEQRRRVAVPLALLGEGRAFAADLVALRLRILTAAAGAMANAPANGPAGTKRWSGGWPPADPQFGRRAGGRWWAVPLALIVLLLIGGAAVIAATHDGGTTAGAGGPSGGILGAETTAPETTATSAGSTPSALVGPLGPTDPFLTTAPTPSATPSTAPARSSSQSTPTSTSQSSATSASTSPSTSPSTDSSSATPTTSDTTTSSSPPPVNWTVTLTTANLAATVTINDGKSLSCAAKATCTYGVVDGSSLVVTVRSGTFTAPQSCAGAGTTCAITVSANTAITITTATTPR